MTEATDTNPDLFPMGDFAGSGFDVGYPYGGEQSEPFFDDARVDPSETVGDQLDDWDVTAVNFAGSVLDGLHVFTSGDFQNALDSMAIFGAGATVDDALGNGRVETYF